MEDSSPRNMGDSSPHNMEDNNHHSNHHNMVNSKTCNMDNPNQSSIQCSLKILRPNTTDHNMACNIQSLNTVCKTCLLQKNSYSIPELILHNNYSLPLPNLHFHNQNHPGKVYHHQKLPSLPLQVQYIVSTQNLPLQGKSYSGLPPPLPAFQFSLLSFYLPLPHRVGYNKHHLQDYLLMNMMKVRLQQLKLRVNILFSW